MNLEIDYSILLSKYRKLSKADLIREAKELKLEIDKVGSRVSSEGFRVLNESSNNLTFAVLQQLIEEKD